MKILSIDSSNKSASAALSVNGVIKAEFYLNNGLTHSQTLAPLTDSLLNLSGFSLNEVDLLAVCNGPGSFTGVRIGVSQVKALSDVYNIPCVEISSLHALAYNLIDTDCIACVALDARCSRVYSAFFDVSDGKIIRLKPDSVLTNDQFIDEVGSFGKKAIVVSDFMFKESGKLIYSVNNTLRASDVCRAAYETSKDCFKRGYDVLPNYLQLSQAEREYKSKDGVKI